MSIKNLITSKHTEYNTSPFNKGFLNLQQRLEGELFYGQAIISSAIRKIYATDASVYQQLPEAVCLPKSVKDIEELIAFGRKNHLTLIPRAAGTSLAGQVVGNGIVVDISKYFTSIIELNEKEGWVRVQPGVIRDDLNKFLRPYGLMFGPETSTSNRAMIGGMIGNNSCGLHSIIWGDTRENVVEIKAILSDGSEVVFGDLTKEKFEKKCELQNLEGDIYRLLKNLLGNTENKEAIEKGFPKKSITRRNTGYALDALLKSIQFEDGCFFNLSKLVAGSEGTLCFITEAKLKLLPLPPKEKCIVAVHTHTIKEALRANIIALQHKCSASELVDHIILEYTKTNIDQSKNSFFVTGEPKAILMVEFFDEDVNSLSNKATAFIEAVKQQSLGYAYPVLHGAETNKAWDLRKAGLGLLRNEPGDTQPVNLIEDCAVDAEDLPEYIDEVEALLKKYGAKYSMYAHAGAGELHVEPMINLKTSAGKILFRTILQETAAIVKKYNGSLSGEHGDGRLRGEFIPFMMGEKNYELFKQVKNIFDPKHVFNKGKIVDTPPMNEFLRYKQDVEKTEVRTVFDFAKQEGILHLAEKCSGSGDCRKTHVSGGTMCPSYMVTRLEKDTTRARANILRQFYTATDTPRKKEYEEVKNILDTCLSCKACKAECPSSVDVGKMKAEFTQQYYEHYGIPLRARLIGDFAKIMKIASYFPGLYNQIIKRPALRKRINVIVGFHPQRTMPALAKTTLRKWFEKKQSALIPSASYKGTVCLFCDEFTNYNDVVIGQKAIELLTALGYKVLLPDHGQSGRSMLSKGLVRKARKVATNNIGLLKKIVSKDIPLIGIEPSAILCFRDEYPDLVSVKLVADARKIAANSFLFEEWMAREIDKGNINSQSFTKEQRDIAVHGHCHQKALSSVSYIVRCLSLPVNYKVVEIPSGCCGMAGAFGYEKEHYALSMELGGLVLFPAIQSSGNSIIAASGTSCRHQIKDAIGKTAKHTAEILHEALIV